LASLVTHRAPAPLGDGELDGKAEVELEDVLGRCDAAL
jgi:hypothetical protein